MCTSPAFRLVFMGHLLLTLGPWPRASQQVMPINSPSTTGSDGAVLPVQYGTCSTHGLTYSRCLLPASGLRPTA